MVPFLCGWSCEHISPGRRGWCYAPYPRWVWHADGFRICHFAVPHFQGVDPREQGELLGRTQVATISREVTSPVG